ncbi:MAG: hypothetical protein LBS50_01400 [Prevotellaceae bacterium]|jgi:hypothetical protein|nr:hypothetical protein [Prevotellaceae bacterium]
MKFLLENISSIILLLTTIGGAIGWLVERKKRNAEAVVTEEQAKKAEQDTKAAEIDNEKKAAEVLQEYIVSPLKDELKALRKEIKKLRGAISLISDCPHAEKCPVRAEMQRSDIES